MTSVLVEQLRALTLDNHASLLDRVTLVDIQGSDPYALSDFISSRPPWYQLAVALVCADLLDPMFLRGKRLIYWLIPARMRTAFASQRLTY